MRTEAYLSDDRLYRYWLLRVWDDSLPIMGNIGVNPSTADETANDPTIRKDIGFATRLGYGGILKLNLAAFRATDPRICARYPHPIGENNSAASLLGFADTFNVTKVAAAWGKNGNYFPDQVRDIKGAFPELWCWGKNSDGTPRHTLMLPYTTELVCF